MIEEEDHFNNLLSFEGEESRQDSIKRKLDGLQQYFGYILIICVILLSLLLIFTKCDQPWKILLSVEIAVYAVYAILFSIRSYLKNWTENMSFIVLIVGTLIHCLGYLGPIIAIVYKEYKNPFAFSLILIINLITCLIPCIVPVSMLLDFYPNNEDELAIFQYLRCHCIPVIQRKLFIIFNFMFISGFTISSFIVVNSSKNDEKCESVQTFYIILLALSLLQMILMMIGVLIYQIHKYIRLTFIISTLVAGIGYGLFVCIEYSQTRCTGIIKNYFLASGIIDLVVSFIGILICIVFQIELFL